VNRTDAPRIDRRTFLAAWALLTLGWEKSFADQPTYPTSVAGVALPRTPLCTKAYALCRTKAPDFLLNHSARTYLFGALHAAHHGQVFDPESAFVAALMHDFGLLHQYASKSNSFEIDGAREAERFAREQGASAAEAKVIWNAIVMHDMRFAIASHESAEATLVAAGAGADVMGPDEAMFDPARVQEVLQAYPRLQFKKQFTALLVNHCSRKPGSQIGTWLEGFCQQHSPAMPSGTEQGIRDAPFTE
jgi:hypothetical protein